MINQTKNRWVLSISMVALLSGCATNDGLFAKYDASCDLPKTKIVERIKVVEKIKTVRVEVPTPAGKMLVDSGKSWEPAVYFGFDLHNLEVKEVQRLAIDVSILKDNPKLKVNVQSFTDHKGSKNYNKKLALRRQATVVDYLNRMTISMNRITVSPLGEELPILGSSEQERTINRRVELMLLDKNGRPLAMKIQPSQSQFKAPFPVR